MKEVIVKDQDLQKAALEGMDEFLDVFVKAIYDAIGGELTAESMAQLNADQLTLLAWNILHEEVMDGGFVQLIYNGYGPFIFKNPLAKALRQWDMRAPSKLIYDAHTLWLKYREEIETEKSSQAETVIFGSDIYLRIKQLMNEGRSIGDGDWNRLEQVVNSVYTGFTERLFSLYRMSDQDYRVSLLTKIHIQPKDIATLTAHSKESVASTRSRLYQKVFGQKGSSKDWDDFILTL